MCSSDLTIALWFTLAFVAAAVVDRRLAGVAVTYLLCGVGAALRPELLVVWFGIGNAVFGVTASVLWFPRAQPGGPER